MDLEKNKTNDMEFYSIADFESVNKIDMHLHVNTNELSLIEQAKKDTLKFLQ